MSVTGSTRFDPVLHHRVVDFLVEYCWLIDNNELERWADCFDEDGCYEIIPRDNLERGLALPLMSCQNKAMAQDRVLALRIANEYNIHWDRHLVSPPRIINVTGDLVDLEASFMVAQTDNGGSARLFASGCYRDRLRLTEDSVFIKRKTVVLDNFCVPTLIATPL